MRFYQVSLLAALAANVQTGLAMSDGVVRLHYNKDFTGQATQRYVTWGTCTAFGDDKYGDKGSSFGIDPGTKCRAFNTLGCELPDKDDEGNTGRNGHRATPWWYAPGKSEFTTPVQWKAYKCDNSNIVSGVIYEAYCDEDAAFCNPVGGVGW